MYILLFISEPPMVYWQGLTSRKEIYTWHVDIFLIFSLNGLDGLLLVTTSCRQDLFYTTLSLKKWKV